MIFEGVKFKLVPSGSLKGKVRREIITTRLLENGAVEAGPGEEPDVNLVSRDSDLHSLSEYHGGKLVDVEWVTQSLARKSLIDIDSFVIRKTGSKRVSDPEQIEPPHKARSEQSTSSHASPNQELVDIFENLAKIVSASPERRNAFRALAYRKASAAVKSVKTPIRTEEDANSLRPLVGPNTIEKIREYLRTGTVKKAELLKKEDPGAAARIQLAGIWGIGPKVANDLVRQGYDTVEKLRASGQHLLNDNQKTGLKYYEELLPKMPRSEVEEIATVVNTVNQEIFGDDLEMVVCGSYRRGADFSSDADLLFSWKLGAHALSAEETMRKLVDTLKRKHFIVDHFNKKNHHTVFLGICRLGPNRSARRFDMKVWPRESLACALLHFTGNADFNRRLRLYAKRHGYKLNDLGLTRADGTVIKCDEEAGIFHALGLEYIAPGDRTSAAQLRTIGGHAWSDYDESDRSSQTSLSE